MPPHERPKRLASDREIIQQAADYRLEMLMNDEWGDPKLEKELPNIEVIVRQLLSEQSKFKSDYTVEQIVAKVEARGFKLNV